MNPSANSSPASKTPRRRALSDGAQATPVFPRFRDCADVAAFLRTIPSIQWAGTLVANPASAMPEQTRDPRQRGRPEPRRGPRHVRDRVDGLGEHAPHAVREIEIPLIVGPACATGAVPVVDMERLSLTAYDLLAGAACRRDDDRQRRPHRRHARVEPGEGFGRSAPPSPSPPSSAPPTRPSPAAHCAPTSPASSPTLSSAPAGPRSTRPSAPRSTRASPSSKASSTPSTSTTAVLVAALPAEGSRVEVEGRCAELTESSAGHVVRVELELAHEGAPFARLTERFAIRGRVGSTCAAPAAPSFAPDVEQGAPALVRRASSPRPPT